MRIAILGIRGVPAKYGGLETCAEEIGARLVARGHEVICYCRYTGTEDDRLPEFRGIKRIMLHNLRYTITDTYTHSFLACCHVLAVKPDVILAFNPAISSVCAIPRVFGYPVVLNPDGFDWRRAKWGPFAKRFIYVSAYMAAKVCNQLIIDAKSVSDYYAGEFDCAPVYIPNGANVDTESTRPEILAQYGIEKDNYFLFLSRHVPENSCRHIIKAFEALDTDKKLVMGGGQAEESSYAASLRETRDPRILFPGPIYDPDHVRELHLGCYALLHGNQPGGTSLGLLKALGHGCCVLTLNTVDNAYAVQDAAVTYKLSETDLHDKMRYVLDHPEAVAELRRKAVARCRDAYNWDVLAEQYEEILRRAARGEKSPTFDPAS
ncbi:MAG TPA: DUF1972 domain-containing protein [Candidatus Hydrogenedentes bacterium]|nr:DUF1972 domain-containing protein [Candidatus Hydrogenedentota bacterium]